MAIRIFSPAHSFVRFEQFTPPNTPPFADADWEENYCPESELPFCLPFFAEDDFHFQLYVSADTQAERDTIKNMPASNVRMIPRDRDGNALLSGYGLPTTLMLAAGQAFRKVRLSDGLWLFYWQSPLAGLLSAVAPGACFRFILTVYSYLPPPGTPVVAASAASNCFTRVLEDCHTTIMQYRNSGDLNDFSYCLLPDPAPPYQQAFFNKARLPITIPRPRLVGDETVYVRSTGERLVQKASFSRQSDVKTDLMPQWAHEAMVAMLMHERVYASRDGVIDADNALRLEGGYEIPWIDFLNYPLAQVIFKAYIGPVLLERDECGICDVAPAGLSVTNITGLVWNACQTLTVNLAPQINSNGDSVTLAFANVAQSWIASRSIDQTAQKATFQISGMTTPGNVTLAAIDVVTAAGQVATIIIQGHWNGVQNC